MLLMLLKQHGKQSIISFAEGDEQRMMLMGLKTLYKICKLCQILLNYEILLLKK